MHAGKLTGPKLTIFSEADANAKDGAYDDNYGSNPLDHLVLTSSSVFRMAEDFALHEVDHLFGDVGGVVGEALQVAGDQ